MQAFTKIEIKWVIDELEADLRLATATRIWLRLKCPNE